MSRKVLLVLISWTFLTVWFTSSDSTAFVQSRNDVKYSGESGNAGPITLYVKTNRLIMDFNARQNPPDAQTITLTIGGHTNKVAFQMNNITGTGKFDAGNGAMTTLTVVSSTDGTSPKFESVDGGYKVTVSISLSITKSKRFDITFKDATLSPFVDDNRKSTWIWVSSLLASLLVAVIISIAVTISVYKWYRSLKTAQAKLAETRLFWPHIQPVEPQPEVKAPEVQVAKKTVEKVAVVELTNQEAYKKTVEDAQHRAQLLGEKLSSKQWLHKDFLRGRHPPRSHEYTVGPEAPLKELEVDVTQPSSLRTDPTQREEDDVKTAVEEFISDETAVEMQHPLHVNPMFSTIIGLLKLPKHSQRFEIYFKLQPLSIINTLKRAHWRMTKYRDSFKVGSPMHQEVSKELMAISKLHQIAKEVMNAKKGIERYRLPYSFQTGEELGMLTRDQLVFAICHECIDEEQVRELKRIVKQMEHRLLIRKAANETERTPQDVEIDKMKERQILMLRTFIEMASKLIAKQKTTVVKK